MKKIIYLLATLFLFSTVETFAQSKKKAKEEPVSDRQYWCDMTYKIARPVLLALSKGELKKQMPIEQHTDGVGREHFAYLEAMGRVLVGIAPWLESGESVGKEGEQRKELTDYALAGIRNAVDPSSPDYMNFSGKYGGQPVVDAAFFAQALLRSPKVLWGGLSKETQQMVIDALKMTREITPGFNNWLLFSGIIEVFLLKNGEQWDGMRVDYAMRQHEQWYKGDGIYGDGPDFHWDYYNSFVIQPMMVDMGESLVANKRLPEQWYKQILTRATRYAEIQERLISPEGAYPPIGRSLAYRMGAFQVLSHAALQHRLPVGVTPAQVRCALTAVMKRQMTAPDTFDDNGWLRIGFGGAQPGVGESYICTASLYLCTAALLPLGLPASDPFWSDPPASWTQKKAWNGEDFPIDHAIR
ncbi:MAG: DUF2264 domain-containing protein [Tannerella sp.]|jgi:hypothetical protein|nr:DUF2264 domain-containing protein [Tannerella sp.]